MNTPNTPANGGQILTDERALFEVAYLAEFGNPANSGVANGVELAWLTGPGKMWQARASLAAPASEPVNAEQRKLAAQKTDWCPNCGQGWGCAVREAEYRHKLEAQSCAAPTPVSGMPDLANRLNELDRHLAKCRFTERHAARQLVYSMLHDVCGIPSPQVPDILVAPGITSERRAAIHAKVLATIGDFEPMIGPAFTPEPTDQQLYDIAKHHMYDIGGSKAVNYLTFARELLEPVAATLPAAPAPTEQQDELPITRSTYGSLEACEAEQARRNAVPTEQAPGDMPTLPQHLLDVIFEYGWARADCVGEKEIRRRLETLIAGIKNYAWAARAARQAPTEAVNGDAIAKSKRILNLVDEYELRPTSGNRTTLRMALMAEFEAVGQAPDSRDARQIADLILGNEGMRIASDLESRTAFGDDIEHRFEIGDGISRTGVVITLTKLRAPKSIAAIAQEKAQ